MTLTPTRRRALEALAATHPRPGRWCNSTTVSRGLACVAHSEVAWLENAGLLVIRDDSGQVGLVLTDRGLAVCREHDIPVRLVDAAADLRTRMEAR